MAIDLDFAARVRHQLLAAGVVGITFQELNQKVRTRVHPTADLRTLLNAWRRRKWVDHYQQQVQQHGGVPKQVWRATSLLAEQWPSMQGAVEALLLAPDLPLGQGQQKRTSDPADSTP